MTEHHYQSQDLPFIDYGLFELPGVRPHPGGGLFRGPAVTGSGYVSCVGAAQTFGRYVPRPFPALLAERLGLETLNLGSGGAGPRFFTANDALMSYVNGGRYAIVQVLSGRSVSNRLLRLRHYGSWGVRSTDGEHVTAEEFYERLLDGGPEQARSIVAETRHNYVREMIGLLNAVTVPKILLWFAVRPPDYVEAYDKGVDQLLGAPPQLVDRRMIEKIRRYADAYAECVSDRGMPQELTTVLPATGRPYTVVNDYYPSPAMHVDAADVLEPVCRRFTHGYRPPRGSGPVRKIAIAWNGASPHHRSGWKYALNGLLPLHHRDGVVFDDFVERRFAWGNDRRPYREPWVGVVHNPPGVPEWFNVNGQAPQTILATAQWRASLPYCQGLFTLSAYLRDWLAARVDVPVTALVHPTEAPAVRFDPDRYRANPGRRLVQVGWWLRRFHSLPLLPTRTFRKTLLRVGAPWSEAAQVREFALLDDAVATESIDRIRYLHNGAYDRLLAENLVFLDLYDSSANNTIVECLARATPVLVNRLPAVEEYLGPDYPLYFDGLDDAAARAEDTSLVLEAHRHMLRNPVRDRLTSTHFLHSVATSPIYRALSRNGRVLLAG